MEDDLEEAAASGSWVERALADVAKFTPKSGYNVVAIDRMAKPGEALYLVKNVADKAEAETIAAAYQKKSGDKTHVYGPK